MRMSNAWRYTLLFSELPYAAIQHQILMHFVNAFFQPKRFSLIWLMGERLTRLLSNENDINGVLQMDPWNSMAHIHKCTGTTNLHLSPPLLIKSDEQMGLCRANSSELNTPGCSKQEKRSNICTGQLHLWSSLPFSRIQGWGMPVYLVDFKIATGEEKVKRRQTHGKVINMLLQHKCEK